LSSEPIKVDGNFPVYFRYTLGIAGEKFFREIKDNGKLVASRCTKCNLNYLPPRIYCERCMSKLDDYIQVESVGTVNTCTICHEDSDGRTLTEPVTVAMIRFPNAHGGLVHKVKGNISIGDKVRPVLKDKSERTGSILDISFFEKVP
jgi:uncharacterized OB-fold protein